MGSPLLVPEKFRVFPVTYRDHREGPGGRPGGATGPRGLRGPSVGRDQPLGGLVHLPQEAQGAWKGGKGKTLGSDGPKAHLGCAPLSPPLGRPPPSNLGLPPP